MEDELPKMIPTSYKVKIPPALSYCCSAKTLSIAWQDVPQFNNFDLLFLCDVPRELHKNNETRFILSLVYSRMHPTQLPRFWEEREGGQWMWLWLEKEARLNSKRSWAVTFDEDAHTFSIT
ncbi:MAG: hypothetical protein EOP06_32775 [Proteobacteria bacterium]|nr:MAG: hypothetical protein EOP06_32775 [Pseudomonadota bacterium]